MSFEIMPLSKHGGDEKLTFKSIPDASNIFDRFEYRGHLPNMPTHDVVIAIHRLQYVKGHRPHELQMQMVEKGKDPQTNPHLHIAFSTSENSVRVGQGQDAPNRLTANSYPGDRQHAQVTEYLRSIISQSDLNRKATTTERDRWKTAIGHLGRALNGEEISGEHWDTSPPAPRNALPTRKKQRD
ncbi:hypothetical protein HY994_06005 [Candidatus Micrarchaeota archaeon]|nr:hypothetical protein [Candidatus Micrarchaeota archaeon]